MSQETKNDANPFEGFKSEAFHNGEPVTESKPVAAASAVAGAGAKGAGGQSAAGAGSAAATSAAAGSQAVAGAADTDDEAAEGEETDDGEDNAAASEGEVPGGEQTTKPKPKPKKDVETRIGELTRARREEERRRTAAERERDEARAEIASLRAGTKPAKEGELTAPAKDDKDADKGRPNPADAKYQYGELDSKYIADVVKFETKKALAEANAEAEKTRQQEAAAAEQRELKDRYDARVAEGAEKYTDFEDKVLKGKWDCSEIVASLLIDSDVGHDVAYHLATNPAEASKIYALEPVQQAAAFGRLEAKFSAPAAATTETPPKVPQLDPPPKSPRGSGGKFKVDPGTTDFAQFEAAYGKQIN